MFKLIPDIDALKIWKNNDENYKLIIDHDPKDLKACAKIKKKIKSMIMHNFFTNDTKILAS